ncbi:hypothetical protein GL279_05180 [Paracoccus limosus]|jgi:nucleotide-binding universal stress UspA family protein|uniref:UspA domain-containing protein n=1 Tax=Paracoccus limosus TaxID=913252 RepID=A0A844GZC9_9RHOB|nr:universal stress protein [Paracoccus limosus]MTH33989.1 hypothetical protein [Paracoccus limosus]
MRLLVGFSVDKGGREALHLAATLARSSGGSLVVATIQPEGWDHPSPARVDAEYVQYLERFAAKAMATAKAELPGDIAAEVVIRHANSAGTGLCRAAEELGVDGVVLGSARSALLGRFHEGTTATEILHSARQPVILAPRGYVAAPQARVTRVTCAVAAQSDCSAVASRAREFASALGVPLRLATFIVRDKQMYPTGAGYDVENLVSNQFRSAALQAHERMFAALPGERPQSVLGDGPTWKAAIDSLEWMPDELLVIGSSHLGPVLQVFLGSNSGKIARFAPVPRMIVPRPHD